MPIKLRQLGAFLLTALIALASPSHALVDDACTDPDSRCDATGISDQASTPQTSADDQPTDDENGSVDLGAQPILLLCQSSKVLPQDSPDVTETCAVVSDGDLADLFGRTRSEHIGIDQPARVAPQLFAGINLMPHGPPHCEA